MPTANATATLSLLVARLASSRVAFPASAVQSIVRAVAIESLAGAPSIIEGTINLRGTPVPMVDVRHRLGLPARDLSTDQFFVILSADSRTIGVRVDDVDDVIDVDMDEMEPAGALSPSLQRMVGIAPLEDGTVVVYDVSGFLTSAEREAIDGALRQGA